MTSLLEIDAEDIDDIGLLLLKDGFTVEALKIIKSLIEHEDMTLMGYTADHIVILEKSWANASDLIHQVCINSQGGWKSVTVFQEKERVLH